MPPPFLVVKHQRRPITPTALTMHPPAQLHTSWIPGVRGSLHWNTAHKHPAICFLWWPKHIQKLDLFQIILIRLAFGSPQERATAEAACVTMMMTEVWWQDASVSAMTASVWTRTRERFAEVKGGRVYKYKLLLLPLNHSCLTKSFHSFINGQTNLVFWA